jgi:YegS/Rv2252/BmrU family lipid kinase
VSASTVFLVNPASGNGATGRRWPELKRRAEALGLVGQVLLSERPGQLTELAAEAARAGSLIVVVGGDGTLNEVVNGAAGTGAEIAVIPAGTGRDFGRTYGIPKRFDDAVRVALDGRTRTVDLGRALFRQPDGSEGSRLFANAGSVGMSGGVARRANSMSKRLGGRATFYAALALEFFGWKNTELTVRFEGGERRALMHDAIVANGQFLGGGMKLAPAAQPDDGLFDLVLVGDVSKLDFVTTSPKLYSGGHIGHPRIEVVRSPWVSIEASDPMLLELDGEHGGTTPVRFEVVPGALVVRVPA